MSSTTPPTKDKSSNTNINLQRFNDGIKYIESDHRIIEDLFNRFQSSQNKSSKSRKSLVQTIVNHISMHASCEERYLYPLFRKHLKNGDMIADRNYMDDQINKEMMQLMLKLDPDRDGDLFDRTVDKFIMIEKEHVGQEEEWLTELRPYLSSQELKDLEDDFLKAKETAPIYPHPNLTSDPSMGAHILHPITGRIDRLMDQMTGKSEE